MNLGIHSRRARFLAIGIWAALLIASPLSAQTEEAVATADATQAESESIPTRSLTGPLGLLVHPVFPPEQARRVYEPLVDYLNQTTDLTVELMVERNFHRYWLTARQGEAPALVLEDAHMIAWRMERFGYQPLATARGTKTYSLLTSGALADDALEDFIGRQISSLPAPSLGYLLLANWFSNPLQQPRILSTATSWLDAVEMVFSAESDAAIAPDSLVSKYPNLYPVAISAEFPGITVAASPDVPEDVRETLIDALTSLQEDPEHMAVLFELDIDGFDASDPADFEGLEDWLDTIFSL